MSLLLKDSLPCGCCGEDDSRESSEETIAIIQPEKVVAEEAVEVEMEMCGCICSTCWRWVGSIHLGDVLGMETEGRRGNT